MNQSKTVEIEGIGTVLFEPSRRAKRFNISLRPFKGVHAAVPCRTSFKAAREFVSSKITWIQKHLDKMKELENDYKVLSKRAADIDKAEAKNPRVPAQWAFVATVCCMSAPWKKDVIDFAASPFAMGRDRKWSPSKE